MFDFLGIFYEYYYLVLVLQAVCVFHSIRRGNQNKWIWIIVFLPFIGSLAYIFTEIVKKRHISSVQDTAINIINPGGRIKELEKNFKFSSTFTNRVALADAYLESGQTEKAIELYEGGLTGVFSENEHILFQLIYSYYQVGRFEEVTKIGPKVRNVMNFSKSRANLLYAKALEKIGKTDLLEMEYKAMNHRFSNYEARFNYGDFLLKGGRKEEAAFVFYDIVDEAQHLSRKEKADSALWIKKSTEEWKKLMN